MRITSKGQVTIPIEIRHELGLHADTEVEFEIDGNVVIIRRARKGASSRGRRLVQRMRGRGTVSMTTAEIMALTRSP